MIHTPENNDENRSNVFKTSLKQKVRFESRVTDDQDSTEDESNFTEEQNKSTEQRSSSNRGISNRIHKRKMPVRRPTAYVSDKNVVEDKNDDDDEDELDDREQQAPSPDIPKFSTLEQKLRELSMKYRQQECSPERTSSVTLTKSNRATCGS
ncbi:hypothetical protein NECAME_16943 [Necator americanus]|uniref:Uncharacterized protein n=1 Tax=Necator americanus TaxID=51031 RepID=W2TVF1_NECAM|nr:hypothetical protein NECAME_16943 [Necator americanus]ETN85032.1 hypothetical protein NECAME_16943 [Necator americanus]